jgi:hypothetical protein
MPPIDPIRLKKHELYQLELDQLESEFKDLMFYLSSKSLSKIRASTGIEYYDLMDRLVHIDIKKRIIEFLNNTKV